MTLGKMLDILQENNVPKSAILLSNSGWECDATDMDGIYYSKELNTVIFTQGTEFEESCGYDEYKLLYKTHFKSRADVELPEREDKVDRKPTESRFKCRAEEGGWCKRWERTCVSWENCELSSYNFPCQACVMSSPLEREECDRCKWKDKKWIRWKADKVESEDKEHENMDNNLLDNRN